MDRFITELHRTAARNRYLTTFDDALKAPERSDRCNGMLDALIGAVQFTNHFGYVPTRDGVACRPDRVRRI